MLETAGQLVTAGAGTNCQGRPAARCGWAFCVLTLQPRTNRFSERVHAEGLLHGVVPAHAAASGKALLASSPPGVIDHVIAAGLPAFTSHTITSPDVLRGAF